MRVGITGGTGFLGSALGERLRARGDTVTVFSRSGGEGRVAWDPLAGPPPAGSLDGLDAVVHLLGEPIVGRWTDAKKRRIRESRVTGTRHLAEGFAAASEPPGVLLSGSGIGIYGGRGDEPVDETAAPGDDFLADVAGAWEGAAAPAESAGARVVYLRTGLVLATGGGSLPAMLPPFRLGLGGRLGDGRQWMPWIHLRDWTGLAEFALDHPTLRGPLNLAAPHPVRNGEFTRTLGRVLGRPTPFAVPAFALRLVLAGMADVVLEGQRARPAVAEAHGYEFAFVDLEKALRDLVGS